MNNIETLILSIEYSSKYHIIELNKLYQKSKKEDFKTILKDIIQNIPKYANDNLKKLFNSEKNQNCKINEIDFENKEVMTINYLEDKVVNYILNNANATLTNEEKIESKKYITSLLKIFNKHIRAGIVEIKKIHDMQIRIDYWQSKIYSFINYRANNVCLITCRHSIKRSHILPKETANCVYRFINECTIDNKPCEIKKILKTYTLFEIPKKIKGLTRTIEAPNPELKQFQRKHLEAVLYKYRVSPYAVGFVKNKNIVLGAMPHLNKKYILKIDIKDFFKSIHNTLITDNYINDFSTHASLKKWINDSNGLSTSQWEFIQTVHFEWFADKYNNRLPEGAPASPYISNLYMQRIDYMLASQAAKNNIIYTRYADDLVFSGDDEINIKIMLAITDSILEKFGLKINKRKIRLIPNTKPQKVLGLLVNKELRLSRKHRNTIRGLLHRLKFNKPIDNRGKGMLALNTMIEQNKNKTIVTNIEYHKYKNIINMQP